MKRFLNLFFLVAALVCSQSAFADNTSVGSEFPGLMRGVRPLGMGNAFLTMPGTDSNAQYYNPAAINDFEKKLHMSFVNPQIDLTVKSFGILQDIKDLNDDIKAANTDQAKSDVFDQFVTDHNNEVHRIGLAVPIAQVRHKFFSVGLISDTRQTVMFHNDPSLDFRSVNVAGISGGSAYAFFDESLQVGGNIKVLYKAAVEEHIVTNDIINEDLGKILGWSAWDKGYGVGFDLGTKYQLPWGKELLHPTVAVTIQDIGHTRFSGGAPKSPMSVSAGGGIFPEFGKFKFAVLADFREIEQHINVWKKTHFGVEALSPKVAKMQFGLRAGANQGYVAVGASAHFPVVKLDVAYYGEESGENSRESANYRLAAQLQFGF